MAEWQVVILRPARRYLEKLSRNEQERILDALEKLQENPWQVPVKPLKLSPFDRRGLKAGERPSRTYHHRRYCRPVLKSFSPYFRQETKTARTSFSGAHTVSALQYAPQTNRKPERGPNSTSRSWVW